MIKLSNNIENEKMIGKFITAVPGENKPWIIYSNSNEGEKNYYRDAFSSKDGCLIYCYGESCRIEGIKEETNEIIMSNDNIDDNEQPRIFEIPYQQYIEDFGLEAI